MKTRTLQQTIAFKASPRDVDEMIMDSRKHSLLSGEKAKISRKVGGSLTAWSGHISGINRPDAREMSMAVSKRVRSLRRRWMDIEQVKR